MKNFSSRQLASTIGLAILALIILYASEATTIIRGLPFLMGAIVLCIQCIVMSKSTKIENRGASTPNTVAVVFSLTAMQLFILGFLNTSLANPNGSYIRVAVDFFVDFLFLAACYYLVAIADNEHQAGGYKAVNFFGYPRSRRLLISIFGGYCTFLPVVIMASIFSLSGNPWIPSVLKAADMSLLMVCIMSFITLALITSRYRGLSGKLKYAALIMLMFIIGTLLVIRLVLGGDTYALIISTATVIILALSMVKLTAGPREQTV